MRFSTQVRTAGTSERTSASTMELVVFLLEQHLVCEGQALDLPNLAIDPTSEGPSLTRLNLTHRGHA
ncbi:MAG: hypothetical protein F2903_09860 [Actinobacteria bacterium]|nr:hypothetical protein [Actinomycetota bacterium]